MRDCNGCHYCCVCYEIPKAHGFDYKKPAKEKCKYVNSCGGCSIHETKPGPCAEYVCMWKEGLLPEEMRPDKINAVFVRDHEHPNGKGFEYYILAMSMKQWEGEAKEALEMVAEQAPVRPYPLIPHLPQWEMGPWDKKGNPTGGLITDEEEARRPHRDPNYKPYPNDEAILEALEKELDEYSYEV